MSNISTILGLAFAGFSLWMLIDCIAYLEEPADRVSWALLIIIFGFVGAPAYFFREYLPRRKEAKRQRDTAND